ncbi:MAG TPA: DUF2934 domain-containing protein [Acetobacteraceae bacterium]|jgi:hypothetical protein|nr:DUF2934 domain-containing protein [Acetobacteraceae bacterium]
MDDRDQMVRERAYHLWEHAGRPDGAQDEFWHRASAEIDQEPSAPPAPSARASDRVASKAASMRTPSARKATSGTRKKR